MKGKCKLCNDTFVGRAGKMFCTIKCKNIYNKDLIEKTNYAAIPTDKILHRNRSILFEIMDAGNFKQKKVERKLLDSKKFNWHHYTHVHKNVKGKLLQIIYDYSWMIFSDQEVLIKKVNKITR